MQPRPHESTAHGGPAATVDHSMRAISAALYCCGTIQPACCSAKSPCGARGVQALEQQRVSSDACACACHATATAAAAAAAHCLQCATAPRRCAAATPSYPWYRTWHAASDSRSKPCSFQSSDSVTTIAAMHMWPWIWGGGGCSLVGASVLHATRGRGLCAGGRAAQPLTQLPPIPPPRAPHHLAVVVDEAHGVGHVQDARREVLVPARPRQRTAQRGSRT